MFFTLLGYSAGPGGGGVPKRLVHNLLNAIFQHGQLKTEISETFFGIVIA